MIERGRMEGKKNLRSLFSIRFILLNPDVEWRGEEEVVRLRCN
jgi:hypothetical protein